VNRSPDAGERNVKRRSTETVILENGGEGTRGVKARNAEAVMLEKNYGKHDPQEEQ
jgi:hypothetical protein